MSGADDLVREFLVESYENLDRLDHELVALEKDPHDREKLASIFRTIHTIKGTCGFLGFAQARSRHPRRREPARRGCATASWCSMPTITTALLAMVDAIRQILASIESTGGEGDADYTPLIEQLARRSNDAATAHAARRCRHAAEPSASRASSRSRQRSRPSPPTPAPAAEARRSSRNAERRSARTTGVARRRQARRVRQPRCASTSACSTS